MHKVALLVSLLLVSSVASADSEYCLAQYKSDFSFSDHEYVTDMTNGLTAEVRWGPHGYVGAILHPKDGDRARVPAERFETYYRALNCRWDSMDSAWQAATQTFSERKDCVALAYGHGEATFQCGHLWESFWLDEDELGSFQRYELRSSGPWYQSEEYIAAKEELDRLAAEAIGDLHTSVVSAVSRPECDESVETGLIEIPENHRQMPTNLAPGVNASISFTVETDGSVSEILLGQEADYSVEYVLGLAARDHVFPEQDESCRVTWNHVFQ